MKNQIERLKEAQNAVILAHYYQGNEVQEIADFIGDSLELAKRAKETKADRIIFCGVKFMAETAKILSPNKKVYQPAEEAGCPMADMASADAVREMKAKYPEAKVVSYVNSTAEVKAESHICCTSSNAVNVVKKLDCKDVIFVPDKNLGAYVASQVPEKNIILWDGFCYVHGLLSLESIKRTKLAYPNALIIAHPECNPEVLEEVDFIGSTSKLLNYVRSSDKSEFIILTERGIHYVLQEENPTKSFIFPDEALYCRNMKKNTLEQVYEILAGNGKEVSVDENVATGALRSLEAMFEV